jgi:hypothetical protein
MVTHMKTTIDIADALLLRAKAKAKADNSTLRNLIERALVDLLDQPETTTTLQPVTFAGQGLNPEFEGASWEKIREAIYS